MDTYQLSEFNYQLGMIVSTMVEAMGMMSANMQRQQLGESMAYTDADFHKLIKDNGIHHNSLVEHKRKMNP